MDFTVDVIIEKQDPDKPKKMVTVDFDSSVLKVERLIVDGKPVTEFLVYDTVEGFIWVPSDKCTLREVDDIITNE